MVACRPYRLPNEDHAIEKPKKTSQAKTMSAGVSPTAGKAPLAGGKGPANAPAGAKKGGRGAAGAVGKAFGVPSTKAKRPGGK